LRSFAHRLVFQRLDLVILVEPEEEDEAPMGYFEGVDVELAGVDLYGFDGSIHNLHPGRFAHFRLHGIRMI
jgi:hypothetical protein